MTTPNDPQTGHMFTFRLSDDTVPWSMFLPDGAEHANKFNKTVAKLIAEHGTITRLQVEFVPHIFKSNE